MAISGFLFLSWRIWEIVITTPIVGMLGWLTHTFVSANRLTPTYVLVLFIVSTLALAWEVVTVVSYLRARHDALFIAITDLCFIGAFIAGVVVLRYITDVNCGGSGVFQYHGRGIYLTLGKDCSILKASFAFGILCILSFAVTFVSYSLVHLAKAPQQDTDAYLVLGSSCTSSPPQRR